MDVVAPTQGVTSGKQATEAGVILRHPTGGTAHEPVLLASVVLASAVGGLLSPAHAATSTPFTTGNGSLRGSFTIQLDDGRTFSGTFAGTLRGGLGTTRFVGRGADGSTVVGRTVESAPGVAVITGTITTP